MGVQIVCWGGPLDGLELTRYRTPPSLVFISPRKLIFHTPHADTEPYRQEGRTRMGPGWYRVSYRYAGGERVCNGCGCYHASMDEDGLPCERCTLCGGALRSLRV